MLHVESTFRNLESRYWPLVKGWQTGLLLVTALAGYLSTPGFSSQWSVLFGLVGSLLLAISGGTALNMWFDRDIDAKMARTCRRPSSTGQVSPGAVWRLGVVLSAVGLGWALLLSAPFAALVAAGLFLEVVIYTIWLKRRTPWSVLWGGLAGGMPILAGRTLAVGKVDEVGLLLALAVLCWIPTHNLTLSMLYLDDYQRAGVPTFPSAYGLGVTHRMIALSGTLAVLAMSAAFVLNGLPALVLALSIVLGAGLLYFALMGWIRPSGRANAGLFKFASVYMLCCMVLLALGGLGMSV
jgi:protoheme IX farnesyltransferase